MDKDKKSKIKSEYYIGVGLCFGVVFGSLFGSLYDNTGLGISLGVVFGLVFGVAWQQYANKKVSKKQELPPKN